MRFTAETHGYLKCKISPRLHERVDVRTDAYGRFSQNQNFLDALMTKFSYPWCFATNNRVNFAEKKYDEPFWEYANRRIWKSLIKTEKKNIGNFRESKVIKTETGKRAGKLLKK